MAVGGYDGMRVIYNALNATKGAGGEALLDAMKGQIFESPRGPVLIDAQTRDIVQDIYIRKVEKRERPAVQRRVRDAQGGEGSGQAEVTHPPGCAEPADGRQPAHCGLRHDRRC